MKTLKFLAALLGFVILLFAGCSDKSQSPVAPVDQSINQPGLLEKKIFREFTATGDPIEITDPGITKEVHGKTILRGMHNKVVVKASFKDGGADLFSGEGDLELNAIINFEAGEGNWWGTLKLKPYAPKARGGQWKLVWYGKATFNPTAWNGGPGWILPIKEFGPGKGGTLTGLHCEAEVMITAPADLSWWHGEYHGFIKSLLGSH
ncbi:MAG: hypothetical protein WCE54_00755 [Ignavibacteriaceae bacterium]